MRDSLGQVLPAGAKSYGHKTALVFGGRSFNFVEVNELSKVEAGGGG
jgi:hypothetical protein